MLSKRRRQKPRRQNLYRGQLSSTLRDDVLQPPELTISPHIVDCGSGTLEVGVGLSGKDAASEVMANKDA